MGILLYIIWILDLNKINDRLVKIEIFYLIFDFYKCVYFLLFERLCVVNIKENC